MNRETMAGTMTMTMNQRWSVPLLLSILIAATGCNGGRYPVVGTVKYADGTPCEGGTVIAEGQVNGKLVGLQANIEKDGTFKMGGAVPGEGALPGTYQVMIMPVALGDSEIAAGKTPSVASRFTKFSSSGLKITVVEGKNDLNIVVSK